MPDVKIEAFVDRILQECEQEGFTVSELYSLASKLRIRIAEQNDVILKSTRFTLPAKGE